jgi:hypothetical protein
MAPQGAEREDSLLKKKAREAHLELLFISYVSPTTAVLLVIFYYPLQFLSRCEYTAFLQTS